MSGYSDERKAAVMAQLLPPHNRPVSAIAAEQGISEQTLYNWRNQARKQGESVPGSGKNGSKNSSDWSGQAKLAVVIETASLSEAELGQYCRGHGLYPEQVQQWKRDCVSGMASGGLQQRVQQRQRKDDNKRIKALQRELNRKDKALAETAALLVLRKKLNALWDESADTTPPTRSGNNS